jgi:hypothetical protein
MSSYVLDHERSLQELPHGVVASFGNMANDSIEAQSIFGMGDPGVFDALAYELDALFADPSFDNDGARGNDAGQFQLLHGLTSAAYQPAGSASTSTSTDTTATSPNELSGLVFPPEDDFIFDDDVGWGPLPDLPSGDAERQVIAPDPERPFLCEHCQKGFQRRTDLTRHSKTHSNDRPYICDHPGCGKSFTAVCAPLSTRKAFLRCPSL